MNNIFHIILYLLLLGIIAVSILLCLEVYATFAFVTSRGRVGQLAVRICLCLALGVVSIFYI